MEKNKIQQKPVLGKGLASLLPGASSMQSTNANNAMPGAVATPNLQDSNKDRHPGISMCGVEDIAVNEFQPRHVFYDESILELAESIQSNGLIQPLIVRKTNNGYQLIAGERRLRAAKLAGLKQVPIVIRRTTDKEALELALLENIQREDLNCIDVALAYNQLIHEFEMNQEELSKRVGKDRSSIANHLRLLKLSDSIQKLIKDNLITFGHAKVLAGLDDAEWTEKLATQIIDEKWSVRELENQIQKVKNLLEAKASGEKQPKDPVQQRLKSVGKELSAKYATKVSLRGNDSRGKIVFEYFSTEDLNRIIDQVMKG